MAQTLWTISGPSGAGKTTLAERLIDAGLVTKTVSTTTRPPRSTEQPNRDYVFVSREDFEKQIQNGDMLEWAVVGQHLYGTSKSALRDAMRCATAVLIVCEPVGMTNIRAFAAQSNIPFASIFLDESSDVLVQRYLRRLREDQTAFDNLELHSRRLVELLTAETRWRTAYLWTHVYAGASVADFEEFVAMLTQQLRNQTQT